MESREKEEIMEILVCNFFAWLDYGSEFAPASNDPERATLELFFDDYARCTLECYQDGKYTQLKTAFSNIERLCEIYANKSEDVIEDLLNAIHFDWYNSGADTKELESFLGEKTLKIWNKGKEAGGKSKT